MPSNAPAAARACRAAALVFIGRRSEAERIAASIPAPELLTEELQLLEQAGLVQSSLAK
jgi:hypothetical protein